MGKKAGRLTAASGAIDPTLDALFTTSAGPVQTPPKSRYSELLEKKSIEDLKVENSVQDQEDKAEGDDEELSEASGELDYEDEDKDEESENGVGDDTSSTSGCSEEVEETQPLSNGDLDQAAVVGEPSQPTRERKRKRKDDNEDLEDKYLSKLARGVTTEPSEKRRKSEAVDVSDQGGENEDEELPQHESLTKDTKSSELEKADRTVYLANVASEVISSKSAKKTLLGHLSSVLDKDAGEKIESVRFRSVAFSTGSMPKRAAYITKQLMEATTKSTNAYAVYPTLSAAQTAVKKLNGTEVLGRHIRVDSVSHPAPTAHRRCVFVGNLGFVDDESVLNTNEEGETVKKKRNKAPADVDEGLWRTFGKQGKVENVRVVRDPKTRVGKGFAYVQFYDANSVESALLLDGKKFPPMLPRALRVTRAKDPRKTAQALEREKEKFIAKAGANGTKYGYKPKATPEEKSQAGRASKLLGRVGAAADRRKGTVKDTAKSDAMRFDSDVDMKTPEQIVFEGTRATSKSGRPKNLKFGKKAKAKGGKPKTRSARRGAEWKKKN